LSGLVALSESLAIVLECRADAANMRITNMSEANAFLRREYRDGWAI